MDTVEVLESGLDIVLSDNVLSGELDSMVARLIALTGELDDVKARNTDLEATVTTLSDDLAESEFQNSFLFTEVEIKNVEIKTLTGKVNSLNVELKSSRLAVTKRKSELRDVKEKLEETEKSNKIEVKKLKKWYKASSKDLHILTSRAKD